MEIHAKILLSVIYKLHILIIVFNCISISVECQCKSKMLINVKDFMLYLNSDLSVYIKAFIDIELPSLNIERLKSSAFLWWLH